MKRFRQPFRSKHSTLGSPQNPDAEKHAISNEEYQRLRADERDRAQERERENQRDRQRAQERDRAEADQIIIQTLQDAARDRGLKIPADLVAVPATSPESQPPSAEIKIVARTGKKPRRKLRAQTVAAPSSGTALERHARKCSICHNADRELIEEDFLHWHPAATIVYDYDIGDTRVVYRHAHATGIYARRMKNVRMAAAHIIEKVEGLTPTAGHVLHAIRALSRIDDEGRWIEPPVEIVVSSGTRRPPAEPKRAEAVELERTPLRPTAESAPSESAGDEPVVSQLIISNRSACRLESPVTDSKQTTG